MDIPQEWGGSRTALFYGAAAETQLFELVARNNRKALHDLEIPGLFETAANGTA